MTARRSNADRSEGTRSALLTSARGLFLDRGYEHVSQGDIVTAAGVTRGALYHHFTDKRDLFRTVFEEMETELTEEVTRAIAGAQDRMTSILLALGAFLDACERPEVRQLMLTDAPAVLGWREWREIEERHGLAVIEDQLQAASDEGLLAGDPSIPLLSKIVLSAVIEAALIVGHAPDPAVARGEAEQALVRLLGGLLTTR